MATPKGTTQEEFSEDLKRSDEFRKQERLLRPLYRIAIEIIKRRDKLGLTQKDLAQLAGTHQTRISKIESSEIDIRLSTLSQIAEALQCEAVISFVPFVKTIYKGTDEPYRALFGTNTQVNTSPNLTAFDTDGGEYQKVSVTEGKYDSCI